MTRERLREFRDLGLEVRQLRAELSAMESRIYAPKGQNFSSTPRGGSHGRTMDDLAAGHIKLKGRYEEKKKALDKERREIKKAMSVLTVKEQRVIVARYFDGKSWADVCLAVHYEWAQTHRIHGSALRKLEAQK